MFTSLENHLKDNEKRKIKTFKIEGGAYKTLANFKSYYKNNFGLKKILTREYIGFKNNVLQEDPIPNKVITGNQKDWYFLGDDYSNVFSSSIGTIHFTKTEKEKIIQELSKIKNWLDKENIPFYLVVAPNKHTAYQELLPISYGYGNKYDDVIQEIKETTDINITVLKPTVLEKKKEYQLYHKTDSHWNDIGAYWGYDALSKTIQKDFPEFESVPFEHFRRDTLRSKHQEMTRMINLDIDEEIIKLYPDFNSGVTVKQNEEKISHFVNPKKKLKAYFCRDSFSNAWIKYFNESFGETIYVKTYRLDTTLVKKERPHMVVLEFAERRFDYFIKYKMPILY